MTCVVLIGVGCGDSDELSARPHYDDAISHEAGGSRETVHPASEVAPEAGAESSAQVGSSDPEVTDVSTPEGGIAFDPDDMRTESVAAGTVKMGWEQLDIGHDANYESSPDKDDPSKCPDPDAMITKGTVDYQQGVYTLTGSGEGFIHGWDQGNLVYLKAKIRGDFTFTAKVDEFEMTNGKPLDGAAEALLNVREDLNYRQPTQSVIAGAPPNKFIFMARYFWNGDPSNQWWHWPAWPETWPDPRPILSWTRITRRGNAFAAYSSTDGKTWDVIKHHDTNTAHPDWYPFQLDTMPQAVYLGLGCSARNDRNYAPMTKLPGKSADCRDPNSDLLKSSARCVFSHLTIAQP